MSATIRALGLLALLALVGRAGAQAPAAAQTPPPGAATGGSAQAEAGDPRADTSASSPEESGQPQAGPAAASSPTPTAPAAPAAAAAAAAGAAPVAAAGSAAAAGGVGAASRATPAHPAQPISGSRGAKPAAADRLELGTATVTGDREQPKVMYVVPWKKSDIGDLSGKPMNSLLDEALAPVDRDEFRREVMYYNVVKADAPQNGAPSPAKGEK